MRRAFHPHTNLPFTPLEYEHAFGKPLDANGNKRVRPSALCPACTKPLHLKGEMDPNVETIFSHNPNTGFCPIKESGKHKYQILPDVDEDTEASLQLKESFFVNWKYHWNRFRTYVGHAYIEDFIKLIEFADKKGIWRYRNLQEHEVVIALLVIKDFKPVIKFDGSVLRERWVRFWFESSVRGLDDFWNLPAGNKVIVKAGYEVPEGESLSADYLTEFEVVEVDQTYLTDPATWTGAVPDYVAMKMKDTLRRHRG